MAMTAWPRVVENDRQDVYVAVNGRLWFVLHRIMSPRSLWPDRYLEDTNNIPRSKTLFGHKKNIVIFLSSFYT